MKRERLVILLGLLVALVFFYLGLNEWLKSKEEQVKPPPVVVKPVPKQQEAPPTTLPPAEKPEQEEVSKQQEEPKQEKQPKLPTPVEKAKEKQEKKEDMLAQKIREEKQKPVKKEVNKKESKTYLVQVGAFKDKAKAENAAQKAKNMGYSVKIVEEDDFYKVRVIVNTDNIGSELDKLRKVFGGAIIKQ
ncbi:MAG: SPOR domain-containing protein [Aquificaceae bacterium]